MWNQTSLKALVRSQIGDGSLVVVSNREPYIHILKEGRVECMRPASGVVSALDPVLKACNGTWVAHGSGSADTRTVDERGRVEVPPKEPRYTLRRVWLTKEEEAGYYYGFANEALWPLCHVVYHRPRFREADFRCYQAVNQKFADAVLDEVGSSPAFIFIQDYHLALLPRILKEHRPDLYIAHFWHIPWPNPEVFRICPWRRELLDGLLGNDILGFHIQYHCGNFLETVADELEARIDSELSAVTYRGATTLVRPFPISVDFERIAQDVNSSQVQAEVERIRNNFSINTEFVGVGVDRMDYTKGIPERLMALSHFFDKYPEYRGRFSFIQTGALSRMHLRAYKDLNDRINAGAERVNWRHGSREWTPIVLTRMFTSYEQILALYRMANLCLVTPLHDGMNLVSKEFIAARNDEQGVLILSQFTGASRELTDALLINPYHIEATAEVIHQGLEMPKEEQRMRMARLREVVAERNVYRWAAKLISSMVKLR
jgi:trehalose 6-phosphate synthase